MISVAGNWKYWGGQFNRGGPRRVDHRKKLGRWFSKGHRKGKSLKRKGKEKSDRKGILPPKNPDKVLCEKSHLEGKGTALSEKRLTGEKRKKPSWAKTKTVPLNETVCRKGEGGGTSFIC